MLRASYLGILMIVVLAGCRSTEREGANPLPENAAPLSYIEMINRARGQATSALDAYYIDSWMDLEQAAQRLEQTARLLPKSTHVPEAFKTKVEPGYSEQARAAGVFVQGEVWIERDRLIEMLYGILYQ